VATYRVGESGATVFNEKGEAIASLRPGYVVVEGLLKNPGSLADQHQRSAKRVRGYADKKITPAEDKSL
jgi:hypothetical protein